MNYNEHMSAHQPLLYFPDEKGLFHAEYMPPMSYEEFGGIFDMMNGLRHRFGRDVYYWHMDHGLDAEDRKRLDLHFIRHVESQHDGEPDDRREAKHYRKLRQLYGAELAWVDRIYEGMMTDFEQLNYGCTHYAVAYHQRWLTAEPEANWNMLYHGVSLLDAHLLMVEELTRIQKVLLPQNRTDEAEGGSA